jgi:phage terminase large subunit GpA-like protein
VIALQEDPVAVEVLATHALARTSFADRIRQSVERMFPSLERPPVPSWLEEHRRLSSAMSSSAGRYRISRTPYLREPLEVLGDDEHQKVVVKKAARLGFTEGVINGFLGYTVAVDPGPVMIVWPTKDDAMDWSKEVLPELFETTLPLRGKLNDAARASDNTILHKAIPGGHIHIVGSNSPRTFRRRNIRYLLIDEVDACVAIARGREGSLIQRAIRRTTTYENRKILITGSPDLLETSQIEKEFEDSDQRHLYVPCPHCGHYQELRLAQLEWDKDETKTGRAKHKFETAHFQCISCEERMEHHHKREMVLAHKYIPHNPGHPTAGFMINAFVSLMPNADWSQLAEEYWKATKDESEMIAFVNTILGEAYEDRGGAPEAGALAKRRETWAAQVPKQVGVLTAGVDVQHDRIELTVVGWGIGQESWQVSHHRIYGDTDEPDVWRRLDVLLARPYLHECGAPMYIQWTFVDSGDEPERVHKFTRPRRGRNVYSVRGEAGKRKKGPILRRSKSGDGSNTLYNLDVDRCKDMLLRRLRITVPGPGMIHFPMAQADGLDDEYLQQFENIKKIERKNQWGRMARYYVDKGAVEAPDCTNYAYGALLALGDAVINELPRLVTEIQKRGEELRHVQRQGGHVPPALPLLPTALGPVRPRLHSKVD